jgi:hypothetical protein
VLTLHEPFGWNRKYRTLALIYRHEKRE